MQEKRIVLMIPGFGEYPETKTFAELIEKLRPQVYELGFLKV